MSVTLDPTFPADSQSPRLGAADIRGLTAEVLELFGESGVASVTYTLPPFSAVDHTTGLVQVQAKPTATLGVATKLYVDEVAGFGGTAAGTNSYTVAVLDSHANAPTNQAELIGKVMLIAFTNANTAAATLQITNADNIAHNLQFQGAALPSGAIIAGSILPVTYNGSTYQILGGLYNTLIPSGTTPVILFDRSVGNPAVDVASSVAETTLYTKSIPGNTLGTDGALRLTMVGDFLNNTAGTATYDLKAKFGGTTVLDGTTTIGGSGGANRQAFRFDMMLVAAGAANLQYVHGSIMTINQFANSVMGTVTAPLRVGEYAGLGIDTTTAQTLAVTITQNTSSASIETRMYATYVELIQPS